MAIYKPQMTAYGIEAEYWKITSLSIVENREQIYAEVVLSGFLNDEASSHGDPLDKVVFTWRGDDYPYRDPLNIDFKTVAYEKIKQSEDFIDGTDV